MGNLVPLQQLNVEQPLADLQVQRSFHFEEETAVTHAENFAEEAAYLAFSLWRVSLALYKHPSRSEMLMSLHRYIQAINQPYFTF
jgi:hypothetical protein